MSDALIDSMSMPAHRGLRWHRYADSYPTLVHSLSFAQDGHQTFSTNSPKSISKTFLEKQKPTIHDSMATPLRVWVYRWEQ